MDIPQIPQIPHLTLFFFGDCINSQQLHGSDSLVINPIVN
jgi:hypothetical protein